MSLRSSQPTAGEAFARFRGIWSNQRVYLTEQRALMVLPTMPSTVAQNLIARLNQDIAWLDALVTTPGIGVEAKGQYNDQAFDVAGEYATYRAAIVNARDTITTMYDGSTLRTFTSTQAAPAVALIDAVLTALG